MKKNKQAEVEKLDLNQEIDEAQEDTATEQVQEPVLAEEAKVDFEGWHALRRAAIPAIHKKEILKADFKARGVPMQCTIADFDLALNKYGVKLA